MISNDFINLSCAVIVSDNTSFTQEIFENILDILTFYIDSDVPIQFKSKLQFANNIAKMRCAGKEPDEIFDSVSLHNQYEDLQDMIHHLRGVNLSGEKVEKAISRIMNKYRVIATVKDIPVLEEFIEKFHNGEIADSSEYVNSYDHLISNIFKRVSETKRVSSHQRISTFDLSVDKFEPVLDQIESSYSGQNSITTGYRNLDVHLNGGFEPTRFYVFGGSSGDGKSCLLMNFVRNAVERDKTHEEKSGLKDIYVYVTLENSIDESLVRLWCSLTQQKISKVIKQFMTERSNIESKMKQWQESNNSGLIMSYFSPTSTSVSDIAMYLKDIRDKYNGIGNVKGIYIDYMDLLKAGRTFDMYRLEMGHVALELKALSTSENIPVISVTQLNRSLEIYTRINIKGIGNVPFHQVRVGDMVKRGNKWVLVKKVFPKEKKKCFKIKTKSGKEIICGPKHNFPTTDGLKNIKYTNLKVGDKLYTVKEKK